MSRKKKFFQRKLNGIGHSLLKEVVFFQMMKKSVKKLLAKYMGTFFKKIENMSIQFSGNERFQRVRGIG